MPGGEEAKNGWDVVRALQETWAILIRDGIIIVPQDLPKAHKPRQRLPNGQRAPIRGRSDWPKGRKLQSRNNLRKEPVE